MELKNDCYRNNIFRFLSYYILCMKFTVIMPVFNEMNNIKTVLEWIYKQTRKPDEIIIADWWSKDWTYEFLKWEEKKWNLKVIKSGNIAESRNAAIKISSNDLILCTDAWCEVDPHWCEAFLNLYEKSDAKVAWWQSELIIKSDFQKKSSYHVNLHKTKPFFSSRNISFYRKVWKEAWWYPEYLTLWWEDTLFNYNIEKKWYEIVYCKKAIVKWAWRDGYKEVYNMYRNYTQWDAEVYMIHGIKQSQSINQAILLSLALVILIILAIFIRWYIVIPLFLWFMVAGLYKRTKWWFLFDMCFTTAKTYWIFVWFRKWVVKWIKIKSKMNKTKK